MKGQTCCEPEYRIFHQDRAGVQCRLQTAVSGAWPVADALDILLFLANNPDYKTARDIVEVRHIKANLVSMNVDKLVQEGYLERYAVASDRRKTKLLCTGKADPIIRKGRVVQNAFFKRLLDHVEPADQEVFFRTMELIGKNLDEIIKENA